ncbi:helix-turn-helix domain-containing protein [Flagellimonas olearia]|uniref:Helix-turn-helix domain-containing protein n=1 Tax=Flagellimonas olearia TaxID=552546 RepID=A0A6I1DW15_9FLAO|nr:helix-turn-helix domain-containing protein [Allomuricauda olearia]KAB7529265.1 helix-turn-helix domain-containing protein [Allomuricauda olearia]
MQNSIILQNLTQEQLEQIIDSKLSEQFARLIKDLKGENDSQKLMTREQTCEFLSINSSTLWHWTNKGKIKAYAFGARRYYKKSELIQALSPCE